MIYRVDHIPKGTPCNRRPALPMVATTITIHNTGNSSSTAQNERGWITNASNTRTASFHIVVDEKEAIECIPVNEKSWHAGEYQGNKTSIGIEICESGNYAQALDNAVKLVAKMLKERGWGVDRLRRHYDWSGKICPRLMYDNGEWTGWEQFKKAVEAELKGDGDVEKAKVYVNGEKIEDGFILDGRAYVPLRAVGEALGAKVGWDNNTKTAKITK
ncbi:N-acetylmuramoyl-L-alanine amidase CwlA precursor [compost metagenome]